MLNASLVSFSLLIKQCSVKYCYCYYLLIFLISKSEESRNRLVGMKVYFFSIFNINLLLTEREGRTGEYWPEVVAVRTERSEVRTKATEGQYSPVRLEQARLVSSLLYGTRVMLVSKLPAFENKKYTSYDHFHGNGPYGKIPTEKEPIRTPGFTPRLPCHIINTHIYIVCVRRANSELLGWSKHFK